MKEYNDLLERIYFRIHKNTWICLSSGIIVGLITHLYMLTNKLPNWDDLTVFQGYGVGGEFGRWMIPKLHDIAGVWSVPSLNGMLAILLFSLATCFIFNVLELKTVTSAVLLPFIMLTFPSIASTMTFMYVADTYAMGLLIGCVGVWLIHKYKYGFIPGVFLLIMCTAVYQSYICFVAGILVLGLILRLFRKEEIKQVLQKGVISLLSLMVSMIGYVILSKNAFGGLNDYKGISKMGQISLVRLPRLIGRAYKRIMEFFLTEPWSFVSDTGKRMNIAVVLIIVAATFCLFWFLKIYNDKSRFILTSILILLFPLALSSIYIIAEEANPTLLLVHQYVLLYALPMGLLEILLCSQEGKEKLSSLKKNIVSIVVTGCLFIVGFDNYVLTSNAYFRMDIAFTRIHSFYERLYIRVAEEEGYQYGDQIAILGDWWPEKNILSSYEIDIDRYEEMEGIAMENGLFTSGVRSDFLKIYLGIPSEDLLSKSETMELMKTQEYKSMSNYPQKGCVKKIKGVWVIRVAD